jgi:hypothetical protein
MHPRTRAGLLALTILLGLVSSANAGFLFESGPNGYSLVAPDGWVRIPPDDVDRLIQTRIAAGGNQSLRYEAAFQAREGMSFKLPYILVQLTPYRDRTQPNEEQMKQMMLAGVADMQPTTEAPPTFNPSNHTFDWTFEANIKDKGKVKGISRGYFGNKALITVHCLMEPSEFQYNEGRYKQVLDSFKYTSFMAYHEKDPWYMTRMFRTGVGCGVTIVFGGFILYARRKNRIAFQEMDAVGQHEATAEIRDGRPYF